MAAKKRISHIASQLNLSSEHADRSLSFFKLAVEHRFVQGRRTDHVVAACMYLVCRHMKTMRACVRASPAGSLGWLINPPSSRPSPGGADMLLDFAESLQVNVFTLGQVYLKLVSKLNQRHLPIIGGLRQLVSPARPRYIRSCVCPFGRPVPLHPALCPQA